MTKRPVESWEGPGSRAQYRWLTRLASLLPRRRGLRRLTLGLATFCDAGNAVVIRHEAGFRFRIWLGDPYWASLLFADVRYEPEVEWCLRRLLPEAELFIDCGANNGFWTNFASGRVPRVIAIEASAVTFERLRANAALVDGDPRLLRAAAHEESGRWLEIVRTPSRHGAAHVVEPNAANGTGAALDRVRTLSLDDLGEPNPRTVLKLDVEGAEVAALRGAPRLWAAKPLIVYEDHGSDPDCRVSRFLLQRGMRLFTSDARLRELRSVAEVAAHKVLPRRGYNFIACHPRSHFSALLEPLVGRATFQ